MSGASRQFWTPIVIKISRLCFKWVEAASLCRFYATAKAFATLPSIEMKHAQISMFKCWLPFSDFT
jgi:hypothetical protein